jgi:hypothetical protein
VGRRHQFVSHHVVDVVCACSATEPHELDLDWRGAEGERILASTLGPAVQIEKEVDVLRVDEVGEVQS